MAMRIPPAMLLVALTVHVSADAKAFALRNQAQNQTPTFTASVDLVRTDAIVRDPRGQFIADLKAGELEVYEDGVKQDIV
jgi:hypothetical protein